MPEFHLPPVQPYHPTTFLERGVLIPFTTPLLGGTRARPGDKHGLELVIPNPSGGQGVYIMDWTSIPALCRPTLHDRALNDRVAAVHSIAPSTIRRVAREVAAEGLAGEEAMQAALAATDTDRGDRTITNYLLLMALIEQVGLFAGAAPGVPDIETRARLTVARIAPRLGRGGPGRRHGDRRGRRPAVTEPRAPSDVLIACHLCRPRRMEPRSVGCGSGRLCRNGLHRGGLHVVAG